MSQRENQNIPVHTFTDFHGGSGIVDALNQHGIKDGEYMRIEYKDNGVLRQTFDVRRVGSDTFIAQKNRGTEEIIERHQVR